jgi:hypothetical protein
VIITLTIFRFSVGDFFSLFYHLRSVEYNSENTKGLEEDKKPWEYDTPISGSDKGRPLKPGTDGICLHAAM